MAVNALASFSPNSAATVTVACTTTSGSTRVALVGNTTKQVTVQSLSTSPSPAFIEFGSSAVTAATATGFPIQPGVVMTITVPNGATHVAGITAATTATVYVTTGDGD